MKPLAFAKLAKYDEATGYFEAVATDETVDAAGEICDYPTSAPLFREWSDTIKAATGGKSHGNVRAMHKAIAAGTLASIEFDDTAKAIKVSGFAVDPVEKMKLGKGCYTGLSIGGNQVGEMWECPTTKAKRYTCQPTEISLVDYPCNGNAFFTVVKDGAGGTIRKFLEPVAVKKIAKGMWTVGRLADLVQSLAYIADDCAYEASWEMDDSPIAGELRDAMKALGAILVRMVTEEVAELSEDDTIALAAKDTIGKIAKFFPSLKQPTEDAAMDAELKKNHDATVAKLATAETELAKLRGDVETVTKARDEAQATITKLQAENTEYGELIVKASERMEALEKVNADNAVVVAKFNAMPMPVTAALRAVSKGQDIGDNAPEAEQVFEADGVTVNKAATAIRHALNNPIANH